jgi:MFS family permease
VETERGTYMSIYMNAISNGNTLGPLICGFIVTGLSWRWHKWIAFILTAVNWIVVVLFCPETRYDRSPFGTETMTSSSLGQTPTSRSEADLEQSKEAVARPNELYEDAVPTKSWTQQLSLWSGVPAGTNIVRMFLRPFPLIILPIVIFSFITYSASLAWVRSPFTILPSTKYEY